MICQKANYGHRAVSSRSQETLFAYTWCINEWNEASWDAWSLYTSPWHVSGRAGHFGQRPCLWKVWVYTSIYIHVYAINTWMCKWPIEYASKPALYYSIIHTVSKYFLLSDQYLSYASIDLYRRILNHIIKSLIPVGSYIPSLSMHHSP